MYSNGGRGGMRGGMSGGGGSSINASRNDNDERKIFVGGISWESTADDLRNYFSKFGQVLDVTLKTDAGTGRSRGFGFVLFGDASSVDRVVADKNHQLHGKQIDPKRAIAGGTTAPAGAGVRKIFVGGLDPSLTEQDIIDHFSHYGKVDQVELPFDKMKNQRRAFGFVTFDSSDVVDKICQNEKIPFGDKMLDVRKAAPKDQQQQLQQNGARGARGGMVSRGGARGGAAGPMSSPYGPPGGYDYNGTYQSGYTGYDYYGGQPAGPAVPGPAYAGVPGAPSYDGGYGAPVQSQPAWAGGYEHSTPAVPGYSAPAGYGAGYDYSGGWQQPDPSAYGKMKGRGGATAAPAPAASASAYGAYGSPTGYHPYNR